MSLMYPGASFNPTTIGSNAVRISVFARARAAPISHHTDAEFCETCIALQSWVAAENETRRQAGQRTLPKDVLGLRSAESYRDPEDAPRIATIYNGLRGRSQWVPFRKGDPEGNRWHVLQELA